MPGDVALGTDACSPSSARSLRTRSAIGGWVEKSVATLCLRSGFVFLKKFRELFAEFVARRGE